MKPNNLSDYLEISAKTHSARTALSGDEVEFRYDELLEKGKALAVLIENQFGEKSNPVMVKVSNHPMDFVAFLAVWLSGNVVVPVHRTAPPGVVEAIQRKARCQLSVDLTPEHTNHTLESLATLDPEPIGPDPALEAGAIVIFTSGSTGHPKGVVLTHTALLGKLAKNQLLLNIGPDDRSLLILNNTFVFGIWFALLTLLNGGCVFTRSRFDPKELVETLVRNRITHLALVPTMVRSLFGSMDPNSLQASQDLLAKTNALRCAILGGEALSAELSIKLRSVLGSADIYDAFGLTETCGNDFVLRPEDYSRFPNSIGTATAGVQYRIVNEDGVEVGPNEVGELQLRTPYLMSGYLGDPEITEAAFIDGWFKTGDLVTENREHYVTIVGRLKEVIVRGGNKITPLEVERALCSCPGIAAAIVSGFPDPVLGQRIQALLIPGSGNQLDADSIKRQLTVELERFKHPDICYVGDDIPTGRTGKLNRSGLGVLLESKKYPKLTGW